jgi:death-on-curing protein
VNYLTVPQVLFIHARLLAETGGASGIRDLALLESAVARPQATFDGADLYPDSLTKAAALMASLVGNHAFVDGNKRVGIAAAAIFLQRNGIHLTATNDEVVAFTLTIAQGHLTVSEIAVWFAAHISPHVPGEDVTS